MSEQPVLGIVVGGGPAPGINGVIAAATLEACNNNFRVVGILDGFQHLMEGKTDQIVELDRRTIENIHIRGGSFLRTSRANPTKNPEHMKNVVTALKSLGVRYLVTIGGDDTAFSSRSVHDSAGGAITVAHVPKTIDNDLPLPAGVPTFGYQTARDVGTRLVNNLMVDARTTTRWYLVVAMGRTAGHLTLGIGKGAGVSLALIPEEFGDRPVTFDEVCDICHGTIIKSMARGFGHGVMVLAEGLTEKMSTDHLEQLFGDSIARDEHGHITLADIELGSMVRKELRRRFKANGQKLTMVSKNIGYELRCADPTPFDSEYTRDLGFGAVDFLVKGGSGAMIVYDGNQLHAKPFQELVDPSTGKTPVRLVDCSAQNYEIARRFMVRLEPEDSDPAKLAELAKAAGCSVEELQQQLGHLMAG